MPRTIFQNIVIQKFEEATSLAFCKYTPIRFFEILHIEKGTGTIVINNHKVKYSDNQLFILIPSDQYNLEIETPTTVSAVKFLNSFFSSSSLEENELQRKEWFRRIEIILHSADRTSNLRLKFNTDQYSLNSLFSVLCNEYNDENLKNEVVLKSTMHTILHIISRNVNFISSKMSSSKIQDIINYIHSNIHDSEKLTKKELANQFHISENYISQYFKNKMNIGLKKYILNYKLKLAETRLKYTDLTVTEISQELGFTDSSHLDKTFLSYKGITAKKYKASLSTTL
ncbi:helix-turn-helix transcriptional regulator [Aquimarina sp. MMG015]|uniref:helix-turn-helix domain-containing protein n=1 Tax=unclassified Aquimarina TaxID=2627091 RepID=UPI000E479876|nr:MULTISPECIES: AraC family transcriptional regulator [unclassified Aquimarina]AXT55233.1 AraC family transcriptional regulator [Aquimarina sp. AD1]MBQ4802194.1 helix-turn-helix transcriptional regulator [Aquimarina sp. MMG015]